MKTTQYAWPFYIIIPMIIVFVGMQGVGIANQIPLVVILAVILLLFFKLSIQVDDNHVQFSMGIGVIHGKYKLEDITYCRSVSYSALGWGIRLKQGAILYNVSGNKAIELDVKGKSRMIWIGSTNPDDLVNYIYAKKGEGKPSTV